MSKRIILENHFHNTSVSFNTRPGQVLSASQVARARRELCGIEGCHCGGAERGDGTHALIQVGAEAFAVFPKEVS